MAEENLKRYRPAILAGKYFKEKNKTAAVSALEELVSTLDLGEDGGDALNAIRSSEEGNQFVADIYSKKYQKILFKSNIGELFEFYSDQFERYLPKENYNEAKRYFEGFKDETYETIQNRLMEAKETLSSERTNISKEEIKKAQEEKAKYEKLLAPLQAFEGLEMKKLGSPLEEKAMKKDLAAMFKPKESTE